jgi:uncharacterized protein YqgQ
MTTEELKARYIELKKKFGKTIFFGSKEADELMEIETELINRKEILPTFYSE